MPKRIRLLQKRQTALQRIYYFLNKKASCVKQPATSVPSHFRSPAIFSSHLLQFSSCVWFLLPRCGCMVSAMCSSCDEGCCSFPYLNAALRSVSFNQNLQNLNFVHTWKVRQLSTGAVTWQESYWYSSAHHVKVLKWELNFSDQIWEQQ
jgi:hypothetical protein